MKKIFILFILFHTITGITKAQQDAQFSQYMFNGIYINPAYAGYKEQLNAHAFYRNQWTGIEGAPKTMSLAIDAIANDGNVGLALQISSDKIGAERNLSFYANYAYRIPMNSDGSSRLAFGIGIGAVQAGVNGALLNPNDTEMNKPVGIQSTINPDARTGVYFSNDHFYAGLSADNLISQLTGLTRPDYFIQPKPHYYLTAGTLLPLNEDIQLKPSFLLKDDRGGPTSLDLTAFIILSEKLWLGGSYRTGVKLYDKSYLQRELSKVNSAAAAVQFFASSNFRLGYSHDFSLGALRGHSGGTHEISIGYFFNKRDVRLMNPRVF